MNDPHVLLIFSVVFILLGAYSIYQGRKRMREAQARGQVIAWYKQINLLTGIEYLLLTLVFLLSLSLKEKIIPTSLNGIIVPFYLGLLLTTAVLAGLVIRQGIINARKPRGTASAQATKSNGTGDADAEGLNDELTPEEQAAYQHRRRERRRNAAAARRRSAGKA